MWLVIGYGNSLGTDDRFGRVVAEEIRARMPSDTVETISVDQLNPELVEPISRSEGVIFVDACTNLPSGQLQCLEFEPGAPTDADSGSWFSHSCSPKVLLEGAETLYRHVPKAWLYMVGGADFGWGESLSPAVANMVPLVVSLIQERIRLPVTVES